MASFAAACPHCQARLKLRDESYYGKKIRCPKCGEAFLVKPLAATKSQAAPPRPAATPAADDDSLAGDDFNLDFESLAATAPPRRPKMKGKSRDKSSSKRKSSSTSGAGTAKIVAVGAAVVLVIGLLIGGGFAVFSLAGKSSLPADRLAWLPEDTEVLIEAQVGPIWNSPMFNSLRTDPGFREMIQQLEIENGKIDDVTRIVIGGASADPSGFVTVVYSRAPISQSELNKLSKKAVYRGHTYYQEPMTGSVICFPNSRVAVSGPESAVKAAIDRQGRCPAEEKFKFVPIGGHLVVGLAPNPAKSPTQSPISLSNVQTSVATFEFGQEIQGTITVNCADEPSAQKMEADIQSFLNDSKTKLDQKINPPATPGLPAGFNPFRETFMDAQKTLNSATTTRSGSVLVGNVTIPGSLVKDPTGIFVLMSSMSSPTAPPMAPGGPTGKLPGGVPRRQF